MAKKTLLLVFIHGFKGSDNTFANFPKDLQALLSHALPGLEIVPVQYPQYETRGDLRECVAKFEEWLQNKVIDLEVANRTPSPTVDPSVHVVLCGHSMGGIVAAETVLSIARDEPVPAATWVNDTTNSTNSHNNTTPSGDSRGANLGVPAEERQQRASSAPPPEPTRLFFPYIQAIMAFDTPYLGISPGVLAHGAEEHFNQASAAYKAFDTANKFFGWSSPRSGSPAPIANASSKGLPAPSTNGSAGGGWGKWGTYAMYAGGAAALAGAAGAAYLNRNQIQQGFAWAGSHLEFVGCLARGVELQKRVEDVVKLTHSHGVGFANFYGALDEKVSSKTQYAGQIVGQDRTFCVVPKSALNAGSPTGSKRKPAPNSGDNTPNSARPPPKRRKTKEEEEMAQEMQEGEQVHQFADDASKGKGEWIKCTNAVAADEIKAHTSMFAPQRNPGYHGMVQRARDWLGGLVEGDEWYASSGAGAEQVGPVDEGEEIEEEA